MKSSQAGAGVLTPSIIEETSVSSNNNGTKVPAPKGYRKIKVSSTKIGDFDGFRSNEL